MQTWRKIIFSQNIDFDEKIRRIFEYQFERNEIYRRFCEALDVTPLSYPSDRSLRRQGYEGRARRSDGSMMPPLLPIQAFKDSKVVTTEDNSKLVFESSGTGSMERSRHYVADAELYRMSLLKGFRHFYDLEKSVIWGYAPGYTDNPHSSLIWMLNELIKQDESGLSRFLPLNEPLNEKEIDEVIQAEKQLILFGAAFGLSDLVDKKTLALPSNSIVIETGGMKTHRREISREELHQKLAKGFDLDESRIHSEYGMCELLSQAYSTGGQWFRSVPWMRVSIRNPDNPMEELPPFKEGLIGIIDLANVHSCSFLLTGDKGMMDKNGRFKVLGRWNPKDMRGCNFLVEED